jgi:hypothetical protein
MKKCPYCAEDIQDEAVLCKHCGETLGAPPQPTSTSTAVPPLAGQGNRAQPGSQQPASKNQGFVGCLAFVILFIVVFAIADISGCEWTKNQSGGLQDSGPNQISKAQWREKVRPYWGPNGPYAIMTAAKFKAVVGEPARTQTVDSEAFWYYDCSDGTIQVKLLDPNQTGGQMAIQSINDY